MNKRISYHLTELKNELRKRAIKEQDEEKRTDYWRLYYKALHAEYEVNGMVADAEVRTLLDYALQYGRLPGDWKNLKDEITKFKEDADKDKPQPPVDDNIDDDDIPPRQLGLWDEEE
jgi:uncharacterized protein YpuA (DUF1002 family)